MRQIVRPAFYTESGLLEGIFFGMYVDILGKVTAGLGNLMDYGDPPWALATMWRWHHKDTGALAMEPEVIAEWHRVKQSGGENWGPEHKRTFAQLVLDDSEMHKVFDWRLDGDEKIYRKRFPDWDVMSADAQMATALYGWGRGANFHKEELVDAIFAAEWEQAAEFGAWTGFNKNRNDAIKGHFMAASKVEDGLDPEQLHYQFAA